MGSKVPRGKRPGDGDSDRQRFRVGTVDELCDQLSSWRGTQFPARAVLLSVSNLFECDDVMILAALPRGELQPARLHSRNLNFVSSYSRELAASDRASWRALLDGRPAKSSIDDRGAPQTFWKALSQFGITHLAAARMESPILPRYPGVLLLMRNELQGQFTHDELQRAGRLAECVGSAMAGVMESRPAGVKALDARPNLPAYVFAISESLEPLFPRDAWHELDVLLRENLTRLAERSLRGASSADATPDRTPVADSRGNLWNFHAVRHQSVPALGGDSIVCLCVQPPVQDWSRLRPDDFAADPEISRLIPSLQYIAGNFQSQPTLGDIAASVSLSPYHFHRCFSERLGITPKHFLLDCQIERAKTLLTAKMFPLSQIAASCGFSHQSHFTSRFKQAVGDTPLRWRKRKLDE